MTKTKEGITRMTSYHKPITAMKRQMQKLQLLQLECLTDWGHVRSACRYDYDRLTKQIAEYKKSIEFLQGLSSGT